MLLVFLVTPDVWNASGESMPETTCLNKFTSDEKAISTSTKMSLESTFRNLNVDRSSSEPSSFTRDKNKKKTRNKNDESDDLGGGVPICLERQSGRQRDNYLSLLSVSFSCYFDSWTYRFHIVFPKNKKQKNSI